MLYSLPFLSQFPLCLLNHPAPDTAALPHPFPRLSWKWVGKCAEPIERLSPFDSLAALPVRRCSLKTLFRAKPLLRQRKKWAASVAPYHGTPSHFHPRTSIFFMRRPISGDRKTLPSAKTSANPWVYRAGGPNAKMNLIDAGWKCENPPPLHSIHSHHFLHSPLSPESLSPSVPAFSFPCSLGPLFPAFTSSARSSFPAVAARGPPFQARKVR
jgi:hypothetical protein